MPSLPKALEGLIAELGKLPGVGRRSAERIAFAILERGDQVVAPLTASLQRVAVDIAVCPACGYFTESGSCLLCADTSRDETALCVVEHALDVVAFERAGGFRGRYHVLGGVLSPLKGVAPEDLRLDELHDRIVAGTVTEVILATSPSVDGDATSLYLARMLERDGLRITRIGRGVPMGGSLEHADGGTLRLALEGRRSV